MKSNGPSFFEYFVQIEERIHFHTFTIFSIKIHSEKWRQATVVAIDQTKASVPFVYERQAVAVVHSENV